MGVFMNARSLTNEKFTEMQNFILTNELDFFAVCETWFNRNTPLHLYEIKGFELINNCREKARCGGTLLWIKKSLKAKLLRYTTTAQGAKYEQIVVKFRNILLIVFYKPPCASVDSLIQCWDELIAEEFSDNVVPLFLGDINSNCEEQPLKGYLESKGLMNQQKQNTRLGRCLDVCIAPTGGTSIDSSVFFDLAFSDHCPIFVKAPIGKETESSQQEESQEFIGRDWSKLTFENWNNQISQMNWNDYRTALNINDLDAAYEHFMNNINGGFESLCPVIVKRKHKQYLPLEIRSWMKERNKLLKLSHKRPQDHEIKEDLKRLRNFVNGLVKEYRKRQAQNKFSKVRKDSHKMWGIFNSLMGRRNKNNKIEIDPNEMNEFLIQPKPWGCRRTIPLAEHTGEGFQLHDIGYDTLFRAISRIKSYKAPGLDSIRSKLIKLGKFELAEKLLLLFNKIIETGSIPKRWKETKVVPIYKNGDPKSPASYRPIALQSIVLKLFERCIYGQLNSVIEPILPPCQHAFRERHSILTATAEITEFMLEGMEETEIGYSLQLDIQKAYDTVNTQILLQKFIDSFDPHHTTLKLIENLLSNRLVKTVVNGVSSKEGVAGTGLPQGSVLSPLLFSFFFTQISEIDTHGKIVMFADDVQLLYRDIPLNERLVITNMMNDFKKVKDYLKTIYMQINPVKTVISRYCSNHQAAKINPDLSVKIDSESIKVEDGARNLGLILDRELNYRRHFTAISKQCSTTLYHLRAIRPLLSEVHTTLLFNSLVLSKIRLFLPLTMTSHKKDLNMLQRVINHGIRVIHQKRKYDSISAIKTRYYWGDIEHLADIELRKFVKQIQCKNSSSFLNNLLNKSTYGRTRRTNYMCKTYKTETGKRTIRNRATVLLNSVQ